MVKSLHISIIMFTFAIGIVGFANPMIREVSTSPFPINKVDVTKKLNNMTKRKTVEDVKKDFCKKWGDLYDYSLITEYINNKLKLPIICRKHGVFTMSANEHLRGHGCPKCADERTGERCRMTLKQFLVKAHKVHGDDYDYSLINNNNFVNSQTKVPIICSRHGLFYQSASDHLCGRGCYKCGKQSMAHKQALTRDEVVKRFNEIFNNKYDYSLFTDYHSKKDIISVVCPKHGVWNVSVSNHLYRHSGCPYCKRSLGEERVAAFLDSHGLEYIEQYRINNESLLCINMYMIVDFFLPKFNTFIEYNGIQHYEESPLFDARTFEQQEERDNAMRLYCKEHKIKLIEIPYTESNNIESILKKDLKL